MSPRVIRALAGAGLIAGTAVAIAVPAGPAVATNTFTLITTPSGTTSVRANPAGGTQFTVKGQTSPDVTSVDVVCTYLSPGPAPRAYVFASTVPVTSGTFTGTATYSTLPLPPVGCRLRAVPSGVDPTNPNTYLGSYAGPVLHTDVLIVVADSGTPFGFQANVGDGDGTLAVLDAAECGVQRLATDPTTSFTPGHSMLTCILGLSGPDLAGTASAITVSGHGAYLPGAVHGYLNGALNRSLPQSALAVHMKVAGNGDVTITESALLMRCSGINPDTFPPTAASCTSLVSAGVEFDRVSTFFRAGHQVRIRDTFTSTDSLHHPVTVQYLSKYSPPATGELGFLFPGHGSQFQPEPLSATVTGLGSKAGTMFVRSDRHAAVDDANADTRGLTWSQPPAKITFDNTDAGILALPYSLSVPASGRAFVGFADSEGVLTSDAKKLAAAAVGDMVEPPIITSPHDGATVPGTTTAVAGKVDAGANGLPTKVTVNGHRARLGATSLTHGQWSVTFSEPLGKHKLTVVATDRAGNTAARSITVRNK